MPELNFKLQGVEPVPYAATPQLAFKLMVTQVKESESPPMPLIQSVMLRCQVRLEPTRRRYQPNEQKRLNELFGEPHRWGQTVRSSLWTNLMVLVPTFTEHALVDLIVPCTYDFNIAATQFFAALDDGEVPLSFLFSGTMFYAGADEQLQVGQISWEKEADFRLPVRVWKQMMQMYYPNIAWLCLRQDVFDRLHQFRQARELTSVDQAIELLLNDSLSPLPAASISAEAQS